MRPVLFFSVVALLITNIACNRSIVSLNFTNARDEVQLLQNLVFRFDKSLVSDSLLNSWDSTPYVRFEPAIEGRFRWAGPDELIFSPSRPLAPATAYRATLGKELLAFSEYGRVSAEPLHFFTPQLKLETSHVTWIQKDERSLTATPRLDLYFNYDVSPAELKDRLHINMHDQDIQYMMESLSPSNKISLQLTSVKASEKDVEAAVRIAKGAKPVGGQEGVAEDINTKVFIPSPYNLTIQEITSQHNGANGIVSVKTSQRVVMDELASHISVDPGVKIDLRETDDGFELSSESFDASKSYLVSLKKGLRGRIGGVLREQYDNDVVFGELEPSLRFTNSKAVYLASRGSQNIELRIVNVPKIRVIVSKIYENNLLAAMRYGYYPKEKSEDNDEYGDEYEYSYASNLDMGDVIYDQELDTRSLPQNGNSRIFNFNFEDRLPDLKGIYHIRVRSAQDFWVADSRFISKTDIGIIAKEASDKMIVFINSIRDAESINSAGVVVYGSNNQVLGTGTTDGSGFAEIGYTRREFAGFKPAMVIVKSGDDFNYLPLSNTRVNTSRYEVGGKRINTAGLDAFIYEERDIYRPGESINFSAIIRDRNWESPGELPVKLKFILPNGKELSSFRKTLSAEGSVEGSIPLSPNAITGAYTLELYTSNDVLLASRTYNVEEFIPDRIRVSATASSKMLRPGEKTSLGIQAVNFFGPPAVNRNYEAEIQVRPKRFVAARYPSYTFDLSNTGVSFDKVVREGKTDQDGRAAESYEVPEMFRNAGLLQAVFYATVFDETGRPVSRNATVDIVTQDVFFGIADDDYWYYPLNQQVQFPLLALNNNQAVVNGARANVRVIRREYRTVLSRAGSYFRYQSQEDEKIVSEQVVTVSGEKTVYNFVPRVPGNYEIRVSIPGSSNYVSRKFYSYGYYGADASSFEVNTEGSIDIELDKSSYLSSETARILFKAPFSGRLLVTVETDRVLSHQYLDVEKRTATMELKLNGGFLPNAYITATLIRPHQVSDLPLTVAHGFKRLKVEESSRKMDVQVRAAKSVRSATKQKVTVKADPGSYVTLAAVDNGVLQVSDFATPDPYAHFYGPRALEVSSFDMYPLLFPEIQARISSTGGDGEMNMKKRTNPMPARRVKLLSYWSGIRKAGSNGEVSFDVEIPSFSGEVRLMALAYKGSRFGSSAAAMTVADPIVLSTALPRFLSPKDTIEVPVTITNTRNSAASASALISVRGPMQLIGPASQTVSIPANSEQAVRFRIVAAAGIGVGSVKVDVNSGGEKFVNETEIGVRPAAPLQVRSGAASIENAGSQRIEIPLGDYIEGTQAYQLVVGRSPALQLGKQFSYLLQYPYGCTEQTISTAFPQLYFDDLASAISNRQNISSPASANVNEAIRKIRMRQLYNGGLTLWEGEGTPHWWTTIYAAHFLLEAKKAGYDVEQSLLDRLLAYVNGRLKTRETISYAYNRAENRKIAPKEVAYSLYVLALAAQPNVPSMNYYKANAHLLSLDAKYLLGVAYAIAGDKRRFNEFLPTSFSGEESVAQTGGSFYSDIRDEAISLNALLDVDPGNAQVPVMAKHVSDKLRQREWYSTQESVFSLLALGKMARASANSTQTAEVKVNGKSIAVIAGKPMKLDHRQLKGNTIEIVTKGMGRMYYYWQSEGISKSGSYVEEDKYLRVRRSFFDRNGNPVTGNTFKQNELVIVQVSVEKLLNGSVENVVVTDLLPAGFELENPRTREIPGMDWIKNAAVPQSLDIRDDRINLFIDLTSNRQLYYYAVRAVSPGVFRMGPVSAEAMYNGDFHSYHGAGTIKVE